MASFSRNAHAVELGPQPFPIVISGNQLPQSARHWLITLSTQELKPVRINHFATVTDTRHPDWGELSSK